MVGVQVCAAVALDALTADPDLVVDRGDPLEISRIPSVDYRAYWCTAPDDYLAWCSNSIPSGPARRNCSSIEGFALLIGRIASIEPDAEHDIP
jgi:hypothetical protein